MFKLYANYNGKVHYLTTAQGKYSTQEYAFEKQRDYEFAQKQYKERGWFPSSGCWIRKINNLLVNEKFIAKECWR